jgi:predicted proteasome-type protease
LYRRIKDGDAELEMIHARWEQSLRHAVEDLPDIRMEAHPALDAQSMLV